MKYKCPCCFYKTIDSQGNYDICPVCFWEDDPVQRSNIKYTGGANILSLEEAQSNYKKYKYSDPEFKDLVRNPRYEELNEKY